MKYLIWIAVILVGGVVIAAIVISNNNLVANDTRASASHRIFCGNRALATLTGCFDPDKDTKSPFGLHETR